MAPRVESFSLPIKDFRFTFVLLLPPRLRGRFHPDHAPWILILTMRPNPIAGEKHPPRPTRTVALARVRELTSLQNPIRHSKKSLPRSIEAPNSIRREETPNIYLNSTGRE